MSKILVTGGAGFIGSHTCLKLLENNYKVIVVDSFCNSNPIVLKRVEKIYNKNNCIEIYGFDLRDKNSLEDLFFKSASEGEHINSVIHFAGFKSVGDSMRNPLEYWDNNLISTINLLEVMDKYSCRTIVFSSSASIYANSNDLISEKNSVNPVNPYGNTKATIEKILQDVFNCEKHKWRIACLRYFNPIGAHSSGLIGENPSGIPNNIFPFILKVASRKIRELKVFGSDWPTHDGTGVRDYIHILDLAEGHIVALEFLLSNKPALVNFNLGTGNGTSVLDLINCFEKVNKVKIPYIFVKRREGDLAHVVADNTEALKRLKWEPKRNLEDMCLDGWRWQKMNPNGYE